MIGHNSGVVANDAFKKSTRRDMRKKLGRMKAGFLTPVCAIPVLGDEGGTLSFSFGGELATIMGRVATPIYLELTAVGVPLQAIDAIKDPNGQYSGLTEVIRQKLLTGQPLFGYEPEGEISKRCEINPIKIGGVKQVNEMIRLAYNAAVNRLRLETYDKAQLLPHTNTAVTPAIFKSTTLERLNMVLDPDDRINGAVELQLPNMLLPVEGINRIGAGVTSSGAGTLNTNGASVNVTGPTNQGIGFAIAPNNVSSIVARLNGTTAGSVSLKDFYDAQRADTRVRQMRAIVDENPELGEEMVLRWAHNLQMDTGRVPFVMSSQTIALNGDVVGASDSAGITNELLRSDFQGGLNFTVPVPNTELGMVIVVFAVLRPDEAIIGMPHPVGAQPWKLQNRLADEFATDPVPVMMRELDMDVPQSSETTIAGYSGYNSLYQTYIDYGLSLNLDPTTVANKTAFWQVKMPLSVTPSSILYPPLSAYPFADQQVGSDHFTYEFTSMLKVITPLTYGPTPIETLAILAGANSPLEQ